MVFPKPKASPSAISSPSEESRVGKVDSRESLYPSSSSAASSTRVQVLDSSEPLVSCVQVLDSSEPLVSCVQVLDSSEPLVSCVQVMDSSEPLVPTSATKPTADVQIVETPESPIHTEAVAGCSHWDDRSNAPQGGVSGIIPESPTFTEESGFTLVDEEHPSSPAFVEPPEAGVAEAHLALATPAGSSGRRIHLYKEEIKDQWNFRKILQVFHSVDATVQFAEERGMILRTKICTKHKKPMVLENKGQLGRFRCRKTDCRKSTVSRAQGTWFENVRLCVTTVFELMYMFTSEFTYEQVQRETKRADREQVVSQHTIADWFSYCRETIVVYELEHDEDKPKIGGPGKIVQIDESKFGRRKYNRGRHVEGHWVLGMVEDGSDDLRVVVCPDNIRSADVLVPLIKKNVAEGSIIHTDMWRAYNCLPQHNYIHRIVNHSDPEHRFVAPDGTHTQRIESHWRGLKRRFHKDNFKGNFEDWLIEFTWRRRIRIDKLDPFEELLKCINYVYKIE